LRRHKFFLKGLFLLRLRKKVVEELRGKKDNLENLADYLCDLPLGIPFSVYDDKGVVRSPWHLLVCRLFAARPALWYKE